ncbi:MarR family winged helix-turn-helix transcriptional regulator [Kitasatospora sp. NPDC050543]|uniref:MarR family winged helix-turn-helix transcriptional regulator n=1 Tax=Kitasatospora sp. NPDC050543 TaxID=3364054 RepID=UPI00379F708C
MAELADAAADGREITTAAQAAGDGRVLAFGQLLGAAGRLELILGRAIEEECGISHSMFEVLLVLGRAGEPGLPMREIGRERVLTTGGVTRLVDRMEAAGLVRRTQHPQDRRVQLVTLTELGGQTCVRAARVHADNVQRYFLDPLPAGERERFVANLRMLSLSAGRSLPRLR